MFAVSYKLFKRASNQFIESSVTYKEDIELQRKKCRNRLDLLTIRFKRSLNCSSNVEPIKDSQIRAQWCSVILIQRLIPYFHLVIQQNSPLVSAIEKNKVDAVCTAAELRCISDHKYQSKCSEKDISQWEKPMIQKQYSKDWVLWDCFYLCCFVFDWFNIPHSWIFIYPGPWTFQSSFCRPIAELQNWILTQRCMDHDDGWIFCIITYLMKKNEYSIAFADSLKKGWKSDLAWCNDLYQNWLHYLLSLHYIYVLKSRCRHISESTWTIGKLVLYRWSTQYMQLFLT